MMFSTIWSVSFASSGFVILGGSVTRTIVGCSLLLSRRCASRPCCCAISFLLGIIGVYLANHEDARRHRVKPPAGRGCSRRSQSVKSSNAISSPKPGFPALFRVFRYPFLPEPVFELFSFEVNNSVG